MGGMFDRSSAGSPDPLSAGAGNGLTTAELISRILQLELQGEQDEARILELEGAAAFDRADRVALRAQGNIDQHLIAELEAQAVIDRTQIANLEVALATARRIGAALGVIMAAYKVTEEQAFATLRTASQHTNRKLRDLAEDVLLSGAVPPNSH
jgi:hypothetical protein